MHVALREGQQNSILAEQRFDPQPHIAHQAHTLGLHQQIGPKIQTQAQGTVRKLLQINIGLWNFQHLRIFTGRTLDQRQRLAHRQAISDDKRNSATKALVGEGQIRRN